MQLRQREIFKVTIVGSVVNALLIVLKFAAGVLGRSSALVADAVHSLTDFISDIIVLIFVRISGKPRDKGHDYGHGKFETLATLSIGLILIGAGIGLGINGIKLVINAINGEKLEDPGMIALIVAVASIIAKEALYHYTIRAGHRLKSEAVVANAWHHRSDAISSLGTLAGISGAIFLGENWRILDPIAAIIVSVFIIKSGYDIVRPCIAELLDGSLPDEQIRTIEQIIRSTDGVRDFHKLRTRKIGNSIALDVHIKMDGDLPLVEAHEIASKIENSIRHEFGADAMTTIHMEPYKPQ